VPESVPTTSETLLPRQRALLLHQLATAPDGTLTQASANKAIPKQIQNELGLTGRAANDIRGRMVVDGWLTEGKVKRVVTYTITEAGRQQLRELERYIPLLPAKGGVNPPADERARVTREAYVLDALARADGHSSTTVAAAGLGRQECLGLNPATARAVLTDLALRGDVQVHRTAGSESYSLTPGGAALLARLRGECPVLPPAGKPTPPPNEAVREGREAFVLLKLLQSAKYALWGSDAAAGGYPKPLKLNHATAWKVRDDLVRRGHVAVHWDGREGCYTLTPAGKSHLTSLPFDALGEVKVKGSALTELLAAAREGAKPGPGDTPTRGQPQPPQDPLTDSRLEAAVMDTFHELLRGPYAGLRMVPIHEIRKRVAERFGAHVVSHTAFDERLLELRRTDRVNLVSIDDRSRATPDQLRDSVFAVGETFFYVEKAHAPA
jgi:DNA-binding PadR family transcriptional regulator